MLAARDETLVFVLGDLRYYVRFGFSVEAAAAFESDYAGPFFQLRRLATGGIGAGRVRYPAAFAALGT
ncbi:MAG: hypothetical protein H3C55_11740 [Pseudorhodoplanes sp.]|nr:hypothetical protein [Pseudorhodoplanes sp.]MBW7950008.1 hypothetical protein [Pseudorhodoplanes sp.]MCQ3942509.1 hypothetical protein [Alphaproteobacteria bacterium]